MHRSIRRGLKRKEPGADEGSDGYQVVKITHLLLLVSPISQSFQAGLTQFQAAARKRESMRLKLQMGAAPGILEKDLADKIRVEESVCKVLLICLQAEPSSCHGFRELQGFSVLVRMRRNASKLPKIFCLAS